jgi:hypothetical protein
MKSHNLSKSIIIFSTLAVLTLGLTGCAILRYEAKSDNIRTVADQIASYTVPEGYREEFAVELMDYQVVSLIGPETSSHIYLIQAPEDVEVNIDQLQQQAAVLNDDHNIDPKQMQVVENRPVVIRGQSATLVILEGLNSENQPYRSATALFEGRSGPALVSISSMVSVWNPEMVDAFLASLN